LRTCTQTTNHLKKRRKVSAPTIQNFFSQNQSFKFSQLKMCLTSLNKKNGPQNFPPALSGFSKAEVKFLLFSARVPLAPAHLSLMSL
jgi:hypothetical protein